MNNRKNSQVKIKKQTIEGQYTKTNEDPGNKETNYKQKDKISGQSEKTNQSGQTNKNINNPF